ncbi:MAG: sialidase, partial [Gemmatimonadaceae bacterium]
PKSPLSYAHVVREDPVRKGLLYLGTENALYVSFDDGGEWQPLQNNLPHAPVYWIVIQPHFHDLVVATYGRGFYILDDLTALEQWTPEITRAPLALFKPRDQYRFRAIADPFTELDDIVSGENPKDGAALNFWLATGAKDTTTKDSVTITIANSAGAVVRTLKAPALAGLNRVNWDLRSEQTTKALIRASPLHSEWFEVKASGEAAPGISRYSILEPPGTYKVTLRHGSAEQSQPLVILTDPSSGGSDAAIAAQMETQHGIVADINDAVAQVNALEIVREQLVDLSELSGKDTSLADLKSSSDALSGKLVPVEQQLYQMLITGRGQDAVRWPTQLTEQLLYLAQSVGGSDYAPTAQQKEVAQMLHERLEKVKAQVDQLLKQDVPAFNEKLRQRNVHPVITSMR